MSAPASATRRIWSIVGPRFAVSVLVIVWTATGAPPPMGTPPTWICRAEAMPGVYEARRRWAAPAGRGVSAIGGLLARRTGLRSVNGADRLDVEAGDDRATFPAPPARVASRARPRWRALLAPRRRPPRWRRRPIPRPLWKAFPLTPAKATDAKPAERPTERPLAVDETPRTRASANATPPADAGRARWRWRSRSTSRWRLLSRRRRRRGDPLVVRRRRRTGHMRDQLVAGRAGRRLPRHGAAGGDEQWVVARSRRFERRSPEPPEYDAASHAAYEQLLQRPLRRWLAALRARPRMVGDEAAPPTAPEAATPARHG